MDPQQRLLLELVWEALEDANLPLESVQGSRTGVFVGVSWNDFLRSQTGSKSRLEGYTVSGGQLSFISNRIQRQVVRDELSDCHFKLVAVTHRLQAVDRCQK